MTGFVVNTHRDGDVMDVSIIGEIDIATAPTVLEAAPAALAQQDVQTVRFDISRVSSVDSCGLAALVEIRQAAITLDTSVVLLDPQPAERRVLELTALHTLFVIEPAEHCPAPIAGVESRMIKASASGIC